MISNFIKNINSTLDIFSQNDARAKIQSRDLVSTLMLSMNKDNRKMSIASLRRSVMAESLVSVARSSFWQRLASPRLTQKIQQSSLKLASTFKGKNLYPDLEKSVGVTQIFLLDSSSITLKNAAKHVFPGCRTNVAPAAIKWHVLFDFTKSEIPWCDISAGSKSDALFFPKALPMVGSLTIFDLGYYNYNRMATMDKLGMYFLSRIRGQSRVKIKTITAGIDPSCSGKYLNEISISENQNPVEFTAQFGFYESLLTSRVVGFWNAKENKYHWYMTNLKCDAKLIFPLYKLRWQIELVFKTVKSSFCFEDLCSANKQIILNLLLLRMNLAFIFFPTMALIFEQINFMEKMAMSIQRAGTIFRWLLPDLKLLLNQVGSAAEETCIQLNKKLKILKVELLDPNFRRRKATIFLCLQPQ
jgi:hypothetical protein